MLWTLPEGFPYVVHVFTDGNSITFIFIDAITLAVTDGISYICVLFSIDLSLTYITTLQFLILVTVLSNPTTH